VIRDPKTPEEIYVVIDRDGVTQAVFRSWASTGYDGKQGAIECARHHGWRMVIYVLRASRIKKKGRRT